MYWKMAHVVYLLSFYQLKRVSNEGLEELRSFHFSISNPMLWLGALVLFFVLLIFWDTRRAFGFSFIVTGVLIINTQVEQYLGQLIRTQGGIFDPLLLRVFVGVFLLFVFLYYLSVKGFSSL